MDEIGSVEFGDWLINELVRQKLLATPESDATLKLKNARVAALEGGKKLLREFLSHQEEMMRLAPG